MMNVDALIITKLILCLDCYCSVYLGHSLGFKAGAHTLLLLALPQGSQHEHDNIDRFAKCASVLPKKKKKSSLQQLLGGSVKGTARDSTA